MKKSKVMKITAIAIVIVLIASYAAIRILGIKAEGETGTREIDTSKWDTENRVNIVYDEDGVPVPVPKGYTASSILREFDGEGNKTKDGERTVNTGFVIYEGEEDIISDATKAMEDGEEKNQAIEQDIENAQTTRNQWVWVPVENMDDIYYTDEGGRKNGKSWSYSNTGRTEQQREDNEEPGIVKCSDKSEYLPEMLAEENQSNLKIELIEEFETTINSIEKYGGFYIGRYETGDFSKQKLKIVKGNSDIINQTWYTMYRKAKEIVQNENKNVKSSIIWRCLWYQTVEWLISTKFTSSNGYKDYSKVTTGCTSWGNYRYSSFLYKNSYGIETTKPYDYCVLIPTGNAEYTKANNIYDMLGNAYDMTLAAGGRDFRIGCGGDNRGTTTNISYEGLLAPNNKRNNTGKDLGMRAMLYIK